MKDFFGKCSESASFDFDYLRPKVKGLWALDYLGVEFLYILLYASYASGITF